MIEVHLVARSATIADLVEKCARREIPFSGPGSLCSELSARGFNTTSAYEAVIAVQRELGLK